MNRNRKGPEKTSKSVVVPKNRIDPDDYNYMTESERNNNKMNNTNEAQNP